MSFSELVATWLPSSAKICLQFIENQLGSGAIGLFVDEPISDKKQMKKTLDLIAPVFELYKVNLAVTAWQQPWIYKAFLRWIESYERMLLVYYEILGLKWIEIKKCEEVPP